LEGLHSQDTYNRGNTEGGGNDPRNRLQQCHPDSSSAAFGCAGGCACRGSGGGVARTVVAPQQLRSPTRSEGTPLSFYMYIYVCIYIIYIYIIYIYFLYIYLYIYIYIFIYFYIYLITAAAVAIAALPVVVLQRNRLAWPHRRRGLASDGVRYAGVGAASAAGFEA